MRCSARRAASARSDVRVVEHEDERLARGAIRRAISCTRSRAAPGPRRSARRASARRTGAGRTPPTGRAASSCRSRRARAARRRTRRRWRRARRRAAAARRRRARARVARPRDRAARGERGGRRSSRRTTLPLRGHPGQGRAPPSPTGGCHRTGRGAHPAGRSGLRPLGFLLGEVDQRRLDAAAEVLGAGQPELEEDRVDVLLDRALGQEELLGDRLVGLALRDLGEDLALARREVAPAARSLARVRAAMSASTTFESTTDPPEATARSAATSCARSETRSFRRYARPSEPCSSSASAYCGVAYWLTTTTPMSGWVSRSRLAIAIPSASSRRRHPDVGEHRVRRLRVDRREELVAVLAERHDLELGRAAEQVAERLAHEVGVVGDHDPQGRRPSPSGAVITSGASRPWIVMRQILAESRPDAIDLIRSGRCGARARVPTVAR